MGTKTPDIVVGSEVELLNAISTAPDNAEYVIGLNRDIVLTDSLEIPVSKNITLMGVGKGVWRLVGANNQNTINVNGSLTIDGICVTHADGDVGRGVYVERNATFTMLGGVISGNILEGSTRDYAGGGVFVSYATFVMLGGEITGNTATSGGGMYSIDGYVDRPGGKIWGNTATHATSSYNDVAEASITKRPPEDSPPSE
ncbi:MAG: hypothetical protein LBH79_00915 [Nitrososphaerota archaeon]|nr:hypothetical protein [Nitrososphaerota archaeon]